MNRILTNGYSAIKKCRHGIFAYNINDAFVGKSLDLYGEWAEAEMNVLESLIHEGDVVLDVGAYIGTHTVFFAKKVGPNGFVIAIEPQRLSFNLLCANIALNNYANVRLINSFASDKRKVIKVPVLDPNSIQNFGGIRIGKQKQGEPLETVMIDSFELPKCNLIKVDVEEAEIQVLEGAKLTIKKCRPILYIENNVLGLSTDIITKLSELNYKCFWHIYPMFNPKNYFANKTNVFASFEPEANMLCFPAESKINLPGLWEVKGINDNWQKALKRKGI